MRILQSANWPWPPVCFLWRPCPSAGRVIVSRDGTFGGGRMTPAPPLFFLVAAVPFGRTRDRLAVRNLRRVKDDLDAALSLHARDRDLDVELSRAREEELVRVGVAREAEGRVLLDQLVQRDRDLVLVALGFWLDGEGDRGLWKRRRREDEGLLLHGEGVARKRLLELRHAADVARGDLGHVLHRLAEGREHLTEALGRLTRGVPIRAVALECARDDAEQRQTPRIRVGDRLEDECGRGAARVGGEGLAGTGLVAGDGLEGVGGGEQVDDLVEELFDSRLVVAARREQDRRDLAIAD